jgi:hypothetical protein
MGVHLPDWKKPVTTNAASGAAQAANTVAASPAGVRAISVGGANQLAAAIQHTAHQITGAAALPTRRAPGATVNVGAGGRVGVS